jgi:homocitrate synthase
VSLTNRTHIAGVHQKAVLSSSNTYEAHNLNLFGVTKNQLLLGPLTGWNFIYYYLKEIENFLITKEQAVEIAQEFKQAVKKQRKKFPAEKILVNIAISKNLSRIELPEGLRNARLENI